ncbi:transcription initiation factor TFIID subunit A-domain-containing protein [Lipomyces orientalis]|uniref:Transcription initiation factor TFIID subunit A-domain-containing protein n=1 Tax=Lipomyces orientalis TaxID=1233043 RepID=A0ACC3TSP6_9ASCO
MSAQQQQGMKDGPQSSPHQQQATGNLHQQLPFQAQHGRGQQNMMSQVSGTGRTIPIARQGVNASQIHEPLSRLSQQFQLEMQQARSFGVDTAEGKQAMLRAAKIKEYAKQLQANSQQYMAQNPPQAQSHAAQLAAAQQQVAASMQQTPVMQQRLPQQGQGATPMTPQQTQQGLPPSAPTMPAARTPQQQQQLRAAQAAQFANMSPAQQHSVRVNQFSHVQKYIQHFQAQINAQEKYMNENPGITPEERAKIQQQVRELTMKREHYVLMAKNLTQQIRMNGPPGQIDQLQQQPSQQSQLAQMQKTVAQAGQAQPLTAANLMSQLAAVQQNNPQMPQFPMQQSLSQQPAGNKQIQMQAAAAQLAQQHQSQAQTQAMQNSQKGFPMLQGNQTRTGPPQPLTQAQQQALRQQQQLLQQQQNQQAAIQTAQQRMQPQTAAGRAISPQNAMQSPVVAQQGLTGAQRAQAIRAGATPNSNLSPRPQATALGQIPNASATVAAAAARTGSPATVQGSPMARPATATQQRLQQQPTPAQQQAVQAAVAVGQTPQAPQTPAGPSARPVLTQQPIMNSQNIFNPSASVISQMPIPTTLSIKQPTPAAVKPARPSLTGGHAASSPVMTSPAIMKPPSFELNGGAARVLSKRKLSELVKDMIGTSSTINGVPLLGDERDTNIDGDVEELLLDLADEFVTSVASFSCRLAKHRKSNTLDVKDVQLHLERNWNIRIPGYNADEIRSVRRWNPTQSYLQKLSGVNTSRAISGK